MGVFYFFHKWETLSRIGFAGDLKPILLQRLWKAVI
jgi:hypothetical protein